MNDPLSWAYCEALESIRENLGDAGDRHTSRGLARLAHAASNAVAAYRDAVRDALEKSEGIPQAGQDDGR